MFYWCRVSWTCDSANFPPVGSFRVNPSSHLSTELSSMSLQCRNPLWSKNVLNYRFQNKEWMNPQAFNVAVAFWQFDTYQRSDWWCAPSRASCWPVWPVRRWWAADGWRWFLRCFLRWPRVLPEAECCHRYWPSSGSPPGIFHKLPERRRRKKKKNLRDFLYLFSSIQLHRINLVLKFHILLGDWKTKKSVK